MLPYIFSVIEVLCGLQLPTLLTILMQISNLHSFFNALAMIMLLKPYRQAFMGATKLRNMNYMVTGQPNISQDSHDRRASFTVFAPAKS